MNVIWPCATTGVSDSYTDHVNRTPPSTNPGTDIKCGWGEEVWAVGDGVVTSITNDTNSAAGRYLTIALDEGGVDQKLHLSKILVVRGQRVSQREIVALSGASGFGSEWGYGPHLHQTFRVNGRNVDFENYANPASAAGGGITPFPQEDTLSAAEVNDIKMHAQEVANNLQANVLAAMNTAFGYANDVVRRESRLRAYKNVETAPNMHALIDWSTGVVIETDNPAFLSVYGQEQITSSVDVERARPMSAEQYGTLLEHAAVIRVQLNPSAADEKKEVNA